MKLEKQPQVKHLVLNVYVRIIDDFNSKWINEAKNNIKSFISQGKGILIPNIQNSVEFQNILWLIYNLFLNLNKTSIIIILKLL
jgi:hypothetical protein